MASKAFPACGGILWWVLLSLLPPPAAAVEQQTAAGIIREAVARHESYGSLCEDLTMVLTGSQGERSVRELMSSFRATPEEGAQLLVVIDAPPELAGVTLLARRLPAGETESSLYLPAFGKELRGGTAGGGGLFLDTDFTPLDFLGERPEKFRYLRGEDARIDLIDYWVIEAMPLSEEVAIETGYGKRMIFVRQDTYFISRIDYLDRHGRLIKRQTRHDLKRIEGRTWRANMVLMEGFAPFHQTLLKRTRTVFAADCAPAAIFTAASIFANPHQAEGSEAEAAAAGDAQNEAAGGP